MSIKGGKLTNGIGRWVNGKFIEVPLKEAGKPMRKLTDKERLAIYRGERNEIDTEKGKL